MKKMNECLNSSRAMSGEIARMFREVGYTNEEDFYNVDIHSLTVDETLIFNELKKAYDKLEEFNSIINYLVKPVQSSGILKMNENGRYETENGYEYTSGSRIEALIYDEIHDVKSWVKSSVESNENGYYIVGYRNVSMDGLQVRSRF